MPSRSTSTRSQSSMRPTMIVITGPMSVGGQALCLAPLEATFDGLGGSDGLRDAERDRGVDRHAAIRGFFHYRDADLRGRELDDDVRRDVHEVDALSEHRLEAAPELRVGLHRQPAWRPPYFSNAGISSAAPSRDISSTMAHARSSRSRRAAPRRARALSAPSGRGPFSRRRERSSGWPWRPRRRSRWRTPARRPRTSRSRCQWPSPPSAGAD